MSRVLVATKVMTLLQPTVLLCPAHHRTTLTSATGRWSTDTEIELPQKSGELFDPALVLNLQGVKMVQEDRKLRNSLIHSPNSSCCSCQPFDIYSVPEPEKIEGIFFPLPLPCAIERSSSKEHNAVVSLAC